LGSDYEPANRQPKGDDQGGTYSGLSHIQKLLHRLP
jgi:hypothetical protein